MNIVLIGVQGSGKGTQAKLLSQALGLPHISSGELFRHHIEAKTKLGIIADSYINRGYLVADQYVYEMVNTELQKHSQGFILDGFPRTVPQEKYLLANYQIDYVFWLELDDAESFRRISARYHCSQCGADYNLIYKKPQVAGICDLCGGSLRQRRDDTAEYIRKRQEKFHQKTRLVFRDKNPDYQLLEVDCSKSVEAIQQKIFSFIGN
ncbi:MAG: nucleoside monophosphate kinase [Candidatus Cloacimonadales bacterium]